MSSGLTRTGVAPAPLRAVLFLWENLPYDLPAGLTVALLALPQAIAFAMLAGIPPVYGLSTAAVTGILAAVLGRSRQVVTGPTTTTGLLILGALTPYLGENGLIRPEHLSVVATLALLAGVIRLILALGGAAHLVRFLPESVLVGFTAGAGTLIGGMQLDEALGLPPTRATGVSSQVAEIVGLFREGQQPAMLAVLLAAGTIVVVALGRRFVPRLPVALGAVAASALGAWALGLGRGAGLPLVSDRSPVVAGWPKVVWPICDPALIQQLLVPASAIVLLGTLELAVSARAGGARPDMRREILAQGWANAAGAFSGCFPASASLTRSSLLRLSGGRTRMASALSGLVVLPVLFLGSGLVGYIPQSALAGLLLVVAWGMVDKTAVRRLWAASPETRLLLSLTFLATLVLPIAWAILLGSGTGLVIHLAHTSAPRLHLLRPEGPQSRRLVPTTASEEPECVVVEVSGDMHYAAVPPFLNEVERLIPASARCIVLDLSHAHEIRFSALRAFERLAELAAYSGATFGLAGVSEEVAALLARCGSVLPAEPADDEPGLSVRRALEAGHRVEPLG
ncbi:MAG: STAS domain-containing protein [Acidobacteria bacterium]|nr:STAS domain-containing protein [Acidobacteriota bacterium]